MFRALVLVFALSASPDAGTRDGGSPKDPCVPLPKAGARCSGSGFCVIDWGTRGGASRALWCRDGKWVIEEERNLDE